MCSSILLKIKRKKLLSWKFQRLLNGLLNVKFQSCVNFFKLCLSPLTILFIVYTKANTQTTSLPVNLNISPWSTIYIAVRFFLHESFHQLFFPAAWNNCFKRCKNRPTSNNNCQSMCPNVVKNWKYQRCGVSKSIVL